MLTELTVGSLTLCRRGSSTPGRRTWYRFEQTLVSRVKELTGRQGTSAGDPDLTETHSPNLPREKGWGGYAHPPKMQQMMVPWRGLRGHHGRKQVAARERDNLWVRVAA